MTAARILHLVILVEIGFVSPHLSQIATFAILAIGCMTSWCLGRWHQKDIATTRSAPSMIAPTLRQLHEWRKERR